jgi:hypothetical protein
VRSSALILLVIASACASAQSSTTPVDGRSTRVGSPRSNMLRADYAGAKACAGCHADVASSYERAPMHNMTRDARNATIAAPFDGTVFRFKKDTATLEASGGERRMVVASDGFGNHTYRITKVIGGKHREDFVGVELREGGRVGDEEILPVSYLLEKKTLRYKGYSVMTEDRPGLRAGPVWRETCIFCHNTVPALSTFLGVLSGESPRGSGYQGTTVDRFLPEARRLRYRIASPEALDRALGAELSLLRHDGMSPASPERDRSGRELLAATIQTTRARFDERHLVDLGIGCEACHGGSREHAADPTIKPSFQPASEAVRVELPSRPATATSERAQWIDRTCARCHQVLFSGYPHTWEGGLRGKSPGGSHINSGEARDLLLGGCASELACTGCHDPHGRGRNAAAFADSFANTAGDAVCTGCHHALEAPDARARHSHHRVEGAGARCVACHMPRKNMGLDGRLTRYHRIGSPTEAAKVESDRPIECALCHGDKTVRALVDDLERWWGKRYDRARIAALYGNLDANVLDATLARGFAHEQAVALSLLGDPRNGWAAPRIVDSLAHPYPIVREYARDALEAITGRRMAIDLHQDKARILEDARAWLTFNPR